MDDDDIQARVDKASQQMGAFKNYVWESLYIDLKAKYVFFIAIPINTLLWGRESWAIREDPSGFFSPFTHPPSSLVA
jgi:hypothetical protein